MERYLGIDLGDARTGFAVSDPSAFLASGIGTVSGLNEYELIQKTKEYAAQYGVGTVVVGVPVNMDGSFGPRAEHVMQFVRALVEKSDLQVVTRDERLSTVQASRYLNATDTRGKKRKGVIDTLSAQIILQDYLDAKRHQNSGS